MAQPPSPILSQAGDLIAGRYRLLRPIGGGGMGHVWAARHELLERDFAIKLASVPTRGAAQIRARFMREAQIIGRLRHPNVVDVADVGELDGGARLYLVMELLEGQSLAQRIAARGPIEPDETVAFAIEICRGLAAAHAAGVVHRDVKPENIFLARSATGGIVPKLVDFGISKRDGSSIVTLPGQLFGTPAYMSPEQALGEQDIDHRTDLWSLGVVLFEMLTATHPFTADSYPALLPLIADRPAPPLPPRIPASLQTIVNRCLEKSRHDRFQSADAVRASLEEALSDLGVPVSRRSTPPVERSPVMPSFRPPKVAGRALPVRSLLGVLAVALAVGAGIVLSVRLSSRPPSPAEHAGVNSTATAITSSAAAPPPPATAKPASAPDDAPPVTQAAPTPAPTSAPIVATRPGRLTPSRPASTPPRPKPVTRVDNAGF